MAIAQQAATQPPRHAPDILITDFEFQTFPSNGKVVGKCRGMDVKLGSSETLIWDSIETKEFIGRKATIQIPDKGTAGGGHLNIDDIVQSNTQAAKW
jgi:hypothetical protein